MDLIPQETLLVGDTFESDIVGANMAGWQTVWLNRRQREMPGGEVVPNFCVRHEEELYDVIVKWIEENKE
ncbi:MAG: HAD family hydrolase, partial [Turicibacter sanguinis]